MDIMILIDRIEELITSAKAVPLSPKKKMVDPDEIYELIDEIRADFPEDLKQARWIVKDRQEMMEAAEMEANRILEDARGQALILAGEQEVVRLADVRAAEIMDQARQMERETRLGAEDYADEVFANLEVNLGKWLTSVQRSRDRLNSKNVQR